MYVKDKNNRITLRLNDSQFSFVKSMSDVLGESPSDFLRMVINTAMASSKMATKVVTTMSMLGGVNGRENDKTDKHD
jgi:negative regulator of replication initiation